MKSDKAIRVLQIGCENFGKGGRSVAIYNLMKMMPGFVVVDYLSSNATDDKSYENDIRTSGGKIVHIKKKALGENRILFEIQRMMSLINIIREGSYDVVHINVDHAWEAFKSIYCVKRAGKAKIIVHGHTSNVVFDKGNIFKKLCLIVCRKYMNSQSDHRLACSTAAAKCLYGKEYENVEIIRNGIDTSKYRYNVAMRNQIREDNCLKENQLLIGFVGRLAEVKNIPFAIDVFNEIHDNNPESVMWIIGEGDLRETLENYVIEKQLHNCIRFLGARNDVDCLLQAMDVLLLPSYWEGLSLITVEAQTAGLLEFASTGIPEEVMITDSLHRLRLDAGCKSWADAINKTIPFERKIDDYKLVKKAGYDSELASKDLLKYM